MRSGGSVGNDAVGYFPSAQDPEADEAGQEPQGRKDSVLFFGGWTYPDDYESGDGTYHGIENAVDVWIKGFEGYDQRDKKTVDRIWSGSTCILGKYRAPGEGNDRGGHGVQPCGQ